LKVFKIRRLLGKATSVLLFQELQLITYKRIVIRFFRSYRSKIKDVANEDIDLMFICLGRCMQERLI